MHQDGQDDEPGDPNSSEDPFSPPTAQDKDRPSAVAPFTRTDSKPPRHKTESHLVPLGLQSKKQIEVDDVDKNPFQRNSRANSIDLTGSQNENQSSQKEKRDQLIEQDDDGIEVVCVESTQVRKINPNDPALRKVRKNPPMKVMGAPLHEHTNTRVIDGVVTTTQKEHNLKAIAIHELDDLKQKGKETFVMPSEFDKYSAINHQHGPGCMHGTSDAGSLPVGSFLSDENLE